MLNNKEQAEKILKSNRNFGLTFLSIFLLLSVQKLQTNDTQELKILLASSVLLAVVSFISPNLLGPFNRVWLKFGDILHNVTTPIIMGLLFYLVITPVGILMRLFKNDPLKLRYNLAVKSYWIQRIKATDIQSTMRNQF